MGYVSAISLSIGISHHETDVVSNQRNGMREFQVVVEQPMNVGCHGALVVTQKRLRRVAGPAIVGGNDPKARIDQAWYRMAPGAPGLGKAMQQNDRPGACSSG